MCIRDSDGVGRHLDRQGPDTHRRAHRIATRRKAHGAQVNGGRTELGSVLVLDLGQRRGLPDANTAAAAQRDTGEAENAEEDATHENECAHDHEEEGRHHASEGKLAGARSPTIARAIKNKSHTTGRLEPNRWCPCTTVTAMSPSTTTPAISA